MKNNLLLLIDGENMLHRAYHKFERLKSKDGKPSGAIFGFMRSLHSMVFRFKPKYVVVTFDNGKSKFRLNLCPDYKAGRSKINMDYESLQKQKRVIRRLLRVLNISTIFDKNFDNDWEGDDFIAYVTTQHIYNYDGDVVIVSSDKDFCQLISKKVKIFNPSKDAVISRNNCRELMGYSEHECVDYLSLVGDSSDNIKGLKGIGDKKAKEFLKKYNSLHNYINNADDVFNGMPKEETKEVWERNRLMIDFLSFMKAVPLTYLPIKYGKGINYHRLLTITNSYDLLSIQTEEFIKTFKKLKVWKEL